MPFQRTITIYERIPVDELKENLAIDEYLLVHVFNDFVEEVSQSFGGVDGFSWDQILIGLSQVDALSRIIDRSVERLSYTRGYEHKNLRLLDFELWSEIRDEVIELLLDINPLNKYPTFVKSV